MKKIAILMILTFSECIFLDKHWSDAVYSTLKPPPVKDGMLKDIRLVNSVEVGKTTFKEVLNLFGNVYGTRLTFDPLYRRKYENSYYNVKYLLEYTWYEKGSPYLYGRNIIITMFFDGQEKLAFMYLNDSAYPEKKDYHNIPDSIPKDQKMKFWPYADCDRKYYQKISNPIIDWVNRYNKDDIQCEWEKDFEKEVPR